MGEKGNVFSGPAGGDVAMRPGSTDLASAKGGLGAPPDAKGLAPDTKGLASDTKGPAAPLDTKGMVPGAGTAGLADGTGLPVPGDDGRAGSGLPPLGGVVRRRDGEDDPAGPQS